MKTTLTACLFLISMSSFSQDYLKSIGLRLGHTSGLTYKKFVNETEALEVLLGGRNEGVQLHLMYQYYKPLEISFDENFHLYYGAGGHLGIENFDNLRKIVVDPENGLYETEDKNYFVMGVDMIGGIEYRILSIPMTVSYELKPYINYIGMRYLRSRFWDSGITIKYIF